jgi:hypothetical protein
MSLLIQGNRNRISDATEEIIDLGVLVAEQACLQKEVTSFLGLLAN